MHYFKSYSTSFDKEKILMEKNSYIVEDDLYIKEGYGAFIMNLPERIKNMDHFHIYDDFYKCDDYELLYYLEENEGYKFVIGPAAPNYEGKIIGSGLYCCNYRDFLNQKNK